MRATTAVLAVLAMYALLVAAICYKAATIITVYR